MKKRSSGLNSFRPILRVAVMDANLLRGSPVSEFAQLADRGLALKVSMEGLAEVWARSLKEDNYSLLEARLRAVAPHLDPQSPVAFVAHALLGEVGTLPEELASESHAFRTDVSNGVRTLITKGLSHTEWKAIGAELKAEQEGQEAQWRTTIQAAIDLQKQRQTVEAKLGQPFYSDKRAFEILINGLAKGSHVRTEPPLVERGALHLRYFARKLVDARSQQPAKNDFSDARHLQHVCEPAYLITTDARLVRAAQRTNSLQSLWVRFPVEIVEDQVFRCHPWGKPLGSLPISKDERSIPELNARQQRFRDNLKAVASPGECAGPPPLDG